MYFTFAVLPVPAALVSKFVTVTFVSVNAKSFVSPAFLVTVTFPPVKSVLSFKLYVTFVGAVTVIVATVFFKVIL